MKLTVTKMDEPIIRRSVDLSGRPWEEWVQYVGRVDRASGFHIVAAGRDPFEARLKVLLLARALS